MLKYKKNPAFSREKAGPYGAATQIWTGDLILTNWLENRKLLAFSSFRAFLFRKNDAFRPIRSTDSIRFFRRVGQVVGQTEIPVRCTVSRKPLMERILDLYVINSAIK